jgi:hypothetical protein
MPCAQVPDRASSTLACTLAAGVLLAACGGEDASRRAQSDSSARSAPAVDPDEYANQVIYAFRVADFRNRDPQDAPETSDRSAFVDTIEELTPPEGHEMAHRQMVSAFDAYVAAREEALTAALNPPGPMAPASRPSGRPATGILEAARGRARGCGPVRQLCPAGAA